MQRSGPSGGAGVNFEAVLRLFRDGSSAELVDRQVAALVLVARENADG